MGWECSVAAFIVALDVRLVPTIDFTSHSKCVHPIYTCKLRAVTSITQPIVLGIVHCCCSETKHWSHLLSWVVLLHCKWYYFLVLAVRGPLARGDTVYVCLRSSIPNNVDSAYVCYVCVNLGFRDKHATT